MSLGYFGCVSVRHSKMHLIFAIFVFFKTGIVGIIREWLKNGCAEDMESIAHAIVFIMHQIRFKSLY